MQVSNQHLQQQAFVYAIEQFAVILAVKTQLKLINNKISLNALIAFTANYLQ
jgi:hypothetical protein